MPEDLAEVGAIGFLDGNDIVLNVLNREAEEGEMTVGDLIDRLAMNR